MRIGGMAMNPRARITMADGKMMLLELYPDNAPITVANFIRLCDEKFFDGLLFHRVVKDYIIQSGSKTGTCEGRDEGFTIKGEFATNGVDTGLNHERGTISMARDRDPDSASTQFFIVHQTASKLDGRYAAFGRLMDEESYAVLDAIANVSTLSREEENRPLVPQVIASITIEGTCPKEEGGAECG